MSLPLFGQRAIIKPKPIYQRQRRLPYIFPGGWIRSVLFYQNVGDWPGHQIFMSRSSSFFFYHRQWKNEDGLGLIGRQDWCGLHVLRLQFAKLDANLSISRNKVETFPDIWTCTCQFDFLPNSAVLSLSKFRGPFLGDKLVSWGPRTCLGRITFVFLFYKFCRNFD